MVTDCHKEILYMLCLKTCQFFDHTCNLKNIWSEYIISSIVHFIATTKSLLLLAKMWAFLIYAKVVILLQHFSALPISLLSIPHSSHLNFSTPNAQYQFNRSGIFV